MILAIYARVSTEKQEKEETIQSQVAELCEFAKDKKHSICKEYVDEGYSGELLDRPALDQLRDDARKKEFEAVLVHSADRLSRNHLHLGLLKEELAKHGVKIIFLNRPERKDTPEEKLLENVEGVIAEYEKAKILERTRRGKLHKANDGLIVGGRAPYGYTYVPGDKRKKEVGHYEVQKAEARVVKLIFNLLVKKQLSLRGIVRELTRRGIPPRRGRHWRTSTVARILTNETYVGKTYYNKHVRIEAQSNGNHGTYRRTKNTSTRLRPTEQWVPIALPESLRIIDHKTFDEAQRQLAVNSKLATRNAKHPYLLKGLVACGGCESPFQGVCWHGKLYYTCGNRHRTFPMPKVCDARSVRGTLLEAAVWDKLSEALKDPRLITGQIDKLKDKRHVRKDIIERDIERAERDLKKADMEESRLLDAYAESIITMEQLRNQMAKVQEKKNWLANERQALLGRLEQDTRERFDMDNIAEVCSRIKDRIDSIRDNFEAKRYILTALIAKIVIEGRRVRIRGGIPTALAQGSQTEVARIASTSSRRLERRRCCLVCPKMLNCKT